MAKLKKVTKKPMKTVGKSKVAKPATAPKKTAKIKVEKIVTKTPKLTVPKAPYKKSEFFDILAEQSGLAKKEVKKVVESIESIIKVHLLKNGPGQFAFPGVFKMTSITKPATKAKKGRNPFTGEEIMIKAKPARRVVKVRVLKKFKTAVE
jgi:nucleoid DNA-binding protein